MSSRPPVLATLPFCFHLLDVAAIPEHHLAKVESGLCADDLSTKPFFDEPWNEAAVVNVGMGKKDKRKALGVVRLDEVVSQLQFFSTLEHAAINQPLLSARFKEGGRARHGPRRTQELHSHHSGSFQAKVLQVELRAEAHSRKIETDPLGDAKRRPGEP